jgi:hypothetical protein
MGEERQEKTKAEWAFKRRGPSEEEQVLILFIAVSLEPRSFFTYYLHVGFFCIKKISR